MVELVGILNITPDSFSDGGQFDNPKAALRQAEQMLVEGASFIDVGAESTRPNAVLLDPNEEWIRLGPVMKELLRRFPGRISLDSYHPETIERVFNLGPVIVNDVTGMNNPAMIDLVTKLKPTVIISHLPGMDIQQAHKTVPISNARQVAEDLQERAALLEMKGLKRVQIILDPGIGFGKTMEVNSQLLRFAEDVPEYAVMIGYSRKRFLGEHRMKLASNLKAGNVATSHGARYLRVHDVAGHSEFV